MSGGPGLVSGTGGGSDGGGQEPGNEGQRNLDFILVAMWDRWNILSRGVAWTLQLLLCAI